MRPLQTVEEVLEMLEFVEYAYSQEVAVHGKASYGIRWKRHYYIQRLLLLQLREFQCM